MVGRRVAGLSRSLCQLHALRGGRAADPVGRRAVGIEREVPRPAHDHLASFIAAFARGVGWDEGDGLQGLPEASDSAAWTAGRLDPKQFWKDWLAREKDLATPSDDLPSYLGRTVSEDTAQHPREITLELIFRQGQRILGELGQIREKQDEIVTRLAGSSVRLSTSAAISSACRGLREPRRSARQHQPAA